MLLLRLALVAEQKCNGGGKQAQTAGTYTDSSSSSPPRLVLCVLGFWLLVAWSVCVVWFHLLVTQTNKAATSNQTFPIAFSDALAVSNNVNFPDRILIEKYVLECTGKKRVFFDRIFTQHNNRYSHSTTGLYCMT